MLNIKDQLAKFSEIADNPAKCLAEVLSSGKKAVGVMPYFAPEELVYAAGMIPFGLWGADMQAAKSKSYFPAFYCGIVHTVLELGLKGKLGGLSAVMIPLTCDSLKGMGANWKYGVKTIPIIDVPYAQNRKTAAGKAFTTAKFKEIGKQLGVLAGKEISDAEILEAIAVYNENRKACLAFTKLAAQHTDLVSCVERSKVLKSRYFMDRKSHTVMLEELNAALGAAAAAAAKKKKIVLSGIIADSEALMKILDENGFAVAADQICYDSVDFRYLVPVNAEDPVSGLAEKLAETEGTSVLFDPVKKRTDDLKGIAEEAKADGVIWVGTKFCDPEEFDYVPVKNLLDEADIPMLTIEIDRQMINFEQIRTAVESFRESLF